MKKILFPRIWKNIKNIFKFIYIGYESAFQNFANSNYYLIYSLNLKIKLQKMLLCCHVPYIEALWYNIHLELGFKRCMTTNVWEFVSDMEVFSIFCTCFIFLFIYLQFKTIINLCVNMSQWTITSKNKNFHIAHSTEPQKVKSSHSLLIT